MGAAERTRCEQIRGRAAVAQFSEKESRLILGHLLVRLKYALKNFVSDLSLITCRSLKLDPHADGYQLLAVSG